MQFKIEDLNSGDVVRPLEEHFTDMYATSPLDSVHVLDVEALKTPTITFFSCWDNQPLLGCVAIKELGSRHAKLKSM